jgi:peptide chain release factor 2
VQDYQAVKTVGDDIAVYLDMAKEDELAMSEAQNLLGIYKEQIDSLELCSILSEKHDKSDCIFSLNAGAGGTDAQDWTQMLYRMYTRWFDKKKYVYEIVDQTMGDEAGMKSVTILVKGLYAYGHIKNEIGIHRLVRISPFNANGKRQTSFAAVDVIPQVEEDVALEIDQKDLRIETFRASGAGGQHVNKTDSAVRITHIPTSVVAQSQASRSQISNRETAMKMLRSRLLVLMEKERKEKLEELRGDVREIAWGNQIRSYVFHPYKLVKDLRTQKETSDVQAVMDGDLDDFIKSHLLFTKN